MYKFTLRIFAFLCILGMVSANLFAQVSLTPGGSFYSQNFDGITAAAPASGTITTASATLPTPWKMDVNTVPRTVGNYTTAGNTTDYIAGTDMPSPASGGKYTFVATANSADKAVGGLNTSNNPTTVNLYVDIQNTSGLQTISNLVISYNIEKYRNGKNNDGASVDLYYSTNPAGPWTLAPAAFTSVYTADANNDGFNPAPGSSRTITSTLSVPIAPSAHLYLAWSISVPTTATGANASNSMALGIDNVRIVPGPAAAPPVALFFRSVATGNWNAASTWESTSDPATVAWAAAPRSPDFNDRTITVRTPDVVTVTANVTTDETIVDFGGKITINSGVALSIHDGTDGDGFDLKVNGIVDGQSSTARLIIKSESTGTDAGTASFGPSTGTVTVSTTVERLISSLTPKSAWRFLTAPLTATGSIFSNWQNSGTYVAGVGTTVSGPNYTTAVGGTQASPINDGATGLDYLTVDRSMYTFNTATQALVPVTNTNTTLLSPSANTGYYIFVRGDRGPGTPNRTTLSATGLLQIGNKSFATSSAANAITLIGNPYAAPVDLTKFDADNVTANSNITRSYYYWDPYITGWYGVGGYVTVTYPGPVITPQGPGSTATESRFLQSGQAMFVQTKAAGGGTASVVFNEAQKDPTSINTIFRELSGNVDNLRIILNVINAGASQLVDGIVASFNNSYSAKVDDMDANKFQNPGESIAFMRDNKPFAVERLPLTGDVVLNLNLYRLKENVTYQFVISPFTNANGLTAYMVDNYLKTTTAIDAANTTVVNFTVNSDAASTGANRFYISFAKPALVQSGNPAISVFPNPVTNGTINLQMRNMPQGIYNVRVMNSMGQVILSRQINHSAGSSTEAVQLGKGAVKGVYQLEVVKPDNTKFSGKVIAN